MSEKQKECVNRYKKENAAALQKYANDKRSADQFNDIKVLAGSESIPANKLVLSSYSKFFESMFLSPMKERYQNEVEIQQLDGKAVRSLIDFMYCGEININEGNVSNLIKVADFLQIEDVKLFCFEFLKDNMSINNCLEVIKLSSQYNSPLLRKAIHSFVADNFDQVTQTISFKNFPKPNMLSLISELDSEKVDQQSLYRSILNWTQEDEGRKVDFVELFVHLDLQKLSIKFLEDVVAKEPLVKENLECLRIVLSSIFAKLKCESRDESKCTKILCVNDQSVFEVYGSTGKVDKSYPTVPIKPTTHRVLKLNNRVYCIGGMSKAELKNNLYELNLSEPELSWKEMAPMLEDRSYFGAAVWKGCLVVNGSFNTKTKTTEVYDVGLNRWNYIASSNTSRSGHELVAVDEILYAIGGEVDIDRISSVERLDDLDSQWREVQSMNIPRSGLAAVAYNGFIYAIGGISDKFEKTVEKYHSGNNVWTNVSSMNVERYGHKACVLLGKIYVIGGKNESSEIVKAIECYDPKLDQWTIIGETEQECYFHFVVAI